MSLTETKKLLLLLQELYPNAAQFRTERVAYAWHLVLEPFDYERIKAAAVEWSRAKPFPPTVVDLRPAPSQHPPPDRTRRHAVPAWMTPYIEALHAAPTGISHYARTHGVAWQEAKRRLTT